MTSNSKTLIPFGSDTPKLASALLSLVLFVMGCASSVAQSTSADRPSEALVLLQPNDRIVFLGDSITQLGARPDGYVDRVSKAVKNGLPGKEIEVLGAGVGGNKVPDLLKRLDRDVLAKNPDVVFVSIGINDVWHWTKPHPVTKEPRQGTTPEDYESGLRELLVRIKAAGATVILCTPTVISERLDPDSPDFKRLEQYSGIVRTLASGSGAGLLDLRKVFVDYLKANNPDHLQRGILTADGVHMNDAGNALIAREVCKVLGVPETAGTEPLHDRPGHAAKPKDMDLYLLIGQSNMAGRAPITSDVRNAVENGFLFNDQGEWEPATNPLNRYSGIRKELAMQKLGPGYSFAAKMHQLKPNVAVGLVVNALGGSKIDSWKKGARLYSDTLNRMKAAQSYGKLKAILWHQGESNCEDATYLEKLVKLIADFRADLGDPKLPFIVGQIAGTYPVNQQLSELPNRIPFTACVSSEGLATQDRWHFNTASQIKLGERYADAIFKINHATNP